MAVAVAVAVAITVAIAFAIALIVAAALAKKNDYQIVDQFYSDTENPVEGKVSNGGWRERIEIKTLRMIIMLTLHA